MEPKVLRNPSDTYVRSTAPTTPNPTSTRLFVQDAAPAQYSYVFHSPVWPIGQDTLIRTAKLRLVQGNAFPGAVTVEVQRINKQISFGRLNYNGRPGVLPGVVSVTKTNAPIGTIWEWDITALLQAHASGGVWWGVRLHAIGSDVSKWFHSNESANPDLRPSLEVSWSTPPPVASGLSPTDGGVVSTSTPLFSWTPPSTALTDEIVSQDFELWADELMASKLWGSGEFFTSEAQLNSVMFWGNQDTTNPGFETNATSWVNRGGTAVLARVTTQFNSGIASLQVTKGGTTTGDMIVGHKPTTASFGFPVMPNTLYTDRIFSRAETVARQTIISFDWYDAAGVLISTSASPQVLNSTTGWVENSFTALSPSNAAFVDMRYTTKTVPAGEIHYFDDHYLGGGMGVFDGLTSNVDRFWRIRRKNSAGQWSKWSPLTKIKMLAKNVGTIVNPPVSPNNFVEDVTPPFSWTFANQKDYEMLIFDVENLATPLWTSGRITDPDQTVEPKSGVIKDPLVNYRLTMRWWDFQNRVSNGTDKDYVEASRDFTYRRVSGVTPATGLTSTQESPFPARRFNFSRTTIPDKWIIEKDGVFLPRSYDGSELLVSGTNYEWKDTLLAGRDPHVFTFHAVQNGQTSLDSPSITVTNKVTSLWIAQKDGSNAVMLVNYSNAVDDEASGEAHTVKGGFPPVLIMEDENGYSGVVTGFLENGVVPGLTAKDLRARWKQLKDLTGTPMSMLWLNEGFEAVIYDMKARPIATEGGGTAYSVSFRYFQTDFK